MGGGGYATAPPEFERGQTFKDGGLIDLNNLPAPNLIGREYLFEDENPQNFYPDGNTSGRAVIARLVRNTSAISFLPGRLVKADPTDPLGCNANAYTFAVGDVPLGIVDPRLPAAGVPPNDLFYVIVSGPAQGITVDSAFAGCAIGDRLVPATGTSGVAADAGKLQKQDVTGTAATLANNIQNAVGRAEQVLAANANTTAVKLVLRLSRHV